MSSFETPITPSGTVADGAVTTVKLADNSVTTAKIVDGQVALADMSDLAQDQFIGRTTASTGVPQTATITAAARTVLDDTTVSAMVDTLGGTAAQGSGAIVRATSPTLTTPVLGVATATSINSTTIPSSKTLVVTTDKLSVLAATTSAELAGVISDETGSGPLVFANAPTVTTVTATGANAGEAAITATGGATSGRGITAAGTGSGSGINATGGATGIGVRGVGGATSGTGVRGDGTGGTAAGVAGFGGSTSGAGGTFTAGGTGVGCIGTGGSGGVGVNAINAAGVALQIDGDSTSPAQASVRWTPQDAQPTGASLVGDMYVGSTGIVFVCTVAGTPGTWVQAGDQRTAASVTYAQIQNVAGLSVVGRSANSSGVPAAITGADGNVLRVSGTALGFGGVAAAAMPALTGDVTTSAGAVATTIASAAVTYAKIANVAGLSVMGRSTNSSGVPADITGTDGQILRVSGTALGFGKVLTSQITGTATNDNATAGDIGEAGGPITRLRANATGISTATPANVCTTTSITLTAGDWIISGIVAFSPDTTTTVTSMEAAISKTSATLPSTATIAVPTAGEVRVRVQSSGTLITGGEYTLQIPPYRVSISGSTAFYLVAQSAFAVSTNTVYGSMEARRMR